MSYPHIDICLLSIADYDTNVHVLGKRVLELPRDEFEEGKIPRCFFMSREMYERLLRRLVLKRTTRIRWKVATATELRVDATDPSNVSYVKVRNADGSEEDIPSSLVIGACHLLP